MALIILPKLSVFRKRTILAFGRSSDLLLNIQNPHFPIQSDQLPGVLLAIQGLKCTFFGYFTRVWGSNRRKGLEFGPFPGLFQKYPNNHGPLRTFAGCFPITMS